ncbi:transporter [Salmonella enterica subsp. enterica]|uniref:Transporter n=1 Tax=Salmonella enterica I TaxID=59201 RepID=A0A379WDQ4_SALET|nr:transporter [Salmonella enterica subsp. enterica]
MISLFFTTMVIQLCNGSISPILALFIKSMMPDSNNIAFLSGLIASVPGISALISRLAWENLATESARKEF